MTDTPRMDWDNSAGGKFSLSVDTAGIVSAFFENDHRIDNVQIPVEKFLDFADEIEHWKEGRCKHPNAFPVRYEELSKDTQMCPDCKWSEAVDEHDVCPNCASWRRTDLDKLLKRNR